MSTDYYQKLPEFIQKLHPSKYKKLQRELYIEDINPEDQREDKDGYGLLVSCHYCGTDLLVDGNDGDDDYPPTDSLTHCDGCMSAAQHNNC